MCWLLWKKGTRGTSLRTPNGFTRSASPATRWSTTRRGPASTRNAFVQSALREVRAWCAGGHYGEIVTTIFPKVRFSSMSACAWRIRSKA